jgi:hypothetical protein
MTDNESYRLHARQHEPRTLAELRAAAQDMLRAGHTERVIAESLNLDLDGLRRLIGQCENCDE